MSSTQEPKSIHFKLNRPLSPEEIDAVAGGNDPNTTYKTCPPGPPSTTRGLGDDECTDDCDE